MENWHVSKEMRVQKNNSNLFFCKNVSLINKLGKKIIRTRTALKLFFSKYDI